MKISKNKYFPFDKFINKALYDKKKGYYMSKNPFGKKGDFITAPNISILFSEMLAIWCIAFWENLGCPKKINIIELGPGSGILMIDFLRVIKLYPKFIEKCNQIFLFEISPFLKKIQI